MTAADGTFTAAEVEAQVAKAVELAIGPLTQRLTELESAEAAAAIEQRITDAVAAAVTPLNAQVAELTTKLDDQTVAFNTEKARADGLEQLITEAGEAETQRAALDARKATRETEAKQAGGFTDAQLAEDLGEGKTRLDMFASLGDEAWQSRLDGWKEKAPPSNKPPAGTALIAGADDGTDPNANSTPARKLAGTHLSGGGLGSLVRR